MTCMECGSGRMRRQSARTSHQVRGVQFEIETTALVCSHCGFQMIPQDRLAEHAHQVDIGYRRAAGLLSAEEIRSARKSLKMTQQQFALYLGVGEASVKRWELGTLQDKSSDDLIRLRTDPDYAHRNLLQLCDRLAQSPAMALPGAVVEIGGPAGPVQRRFDPGARSGSAAAGRPAPSQDALPAACPRPKMARQKRPA